MSDPVIHIILCTHYLVQGVVLLGGGGGMLSQLAKGDRAMLAKG